MIYILGILLIILTVSILVSYILYKLMKDSYDERIRKLELKNKGLSKSAKDWKNEYIKEKKKND